MSGERKRQSGGDAGTAEAAVGTVGELTIAVNTPADAFGGGEHGKEG